MPIGNRIFPRSKQDISAYAALLRTVPVAIIDDAMSRMYAMSSAIHPVTAEAELSGPAFTVKVREGDNLMLHKAIDLAKSGDVLVISSLSGNDRALLGEIIAQKCLTRKIAGIVLDGCVRDRLVLQNCPLPIFAVGFTPNGPTKHGPGEINVPVACGGVVVRPGDLIRGDHDGVVVIPAQDLCSVWETAAKLYQNDRLKFERAVQGTWHSETIETLVQKSGASYE